MDSWDDLEACYRTLDLPPDASPDEVKTAWRDLVKIWHPDRFASEPRLQHRCQEKIKQINLAYETLKQRFDDPASVPAVYHPEPPLRCVRCGRILPRGTRECDWCVSADGTPLPIRERTTWRWTLTGIAIIIIAATVFHFAFDGLQHTFTYLFLLLASFAFLRQVYHSLR